MNNIVLVIYANTLIDFINVVNFNKVMDFVMVLICNKLMDFIKVKNCIRVINFIKVWIFLKRIIVEYWQGPTKPGKYLKQNKFHQVIYFINLTNEMKVIKFIRLMLIFWSINTRDLYTELYLGIDHFWSQNCDFTTFLGCVWVGGRNQY